MKSLPYLCGRKREGIKNHHYQRKYSAAVLHLSTQKMVSTIRLSNAISAAPSLRPAYRKRII